MAKRLAGTVFVKCDGEQFDISGGVECPLLKAKREPVSGPNGVAGYKETSIPPYVKLSAFVPDKFPIEKLQNATEMTVTVEFPNGKNYVLSSAFVSNDPSVKADDGTTDLEFGGLNGDWL